MEEEDHFTQTLLPTLIAALAAAAIAALYFHSILFTFSQSSLTLLLSTRHASL
jgi:hypothetical protein